jgi:hypothetical protein
MRPATATDERPLSRKNLAEAEVPVNLLALADGKRQI